MTRVLRRLGVVLAGLVVVVASYAAAALVGTVIPGGEPERHPISAASQTVTIHVIATPIHTDVVLPMRAAGIDLSALITAPAFSADEATLDLWRGAVSHVAVSWGSRAFFEDVPTWDRLRPVHVASALVDDSAVHLTLLGDPSNMPGAVTLSVSEDAYRALVEGIGAALDGGFADPKPLAGRGYAEFDGFYAGAETYHAFRTCNVWMGDLLAKAGVRVGVWTPHSQGLMWSLRRSPAANG